MRQGEEREAQEVRDIYIYICVCVCQTMTDSCRCMAETNTTMESNFPQIKVKNENTAVSSRFLLLALSRAKALPSHAQRRAAFTVTDKLLSWILGEFVTHGEPNLNREIKY